MYRLEYRKYSILFWNPADPKPNLMLTPTNTGLKRFWDSTITDRKPAKKRQDHFGSLLALPFHSNLISTISSDQGI